MEGEQIALGIVNVVGGVAVIGSYAHGLLKSPENRDRFWGDVPARLKPFYTALMPLAALGYFAFTYFILFRVDPARMMVGDTFGFSYFFVLYALILFPSAMWMPLTFLMLRRPSGVLWMTIRSVLAIVGLSSVALLLGLLLLSPTASGVAYWLAVAGAAFFSLQTALLDGLVWPAYFLPTDLPDSKESPYPAS